MKQIWIEYRATRPHLPMTFWVHKAVGEACCWSEASSYSPPLQIRIVGKGYPVFHVEIDGFVFRFSSFDEINECIAVLGQKVLPRTIDLSKKRTTSFGPNNHWLSRLPSRVKRWKYREKAVCYLKRSLHEFELLLK